MYARQFSVDEKGQLVSSVVHLVKDQNEYIDDFQISATIAQAKQTFSFLSQAISIGELMLLSNGSTMYIRHEAKQKWLKTI